MQPPDLPNTFRFGDFELDVTAYALRRGGQQVRLERRPMELLILLVQRRRELVSGNDIVTRVWDAGVVVDVDMGVNTAIRKISLRGYILATSGRRDEAAQALSTLEAMAHERYVPPYALALIHAGLGHRERAVEWLEQAYKVRDVHLVWLPVDRRWDAFRTESAFVGLIERCGFTREHSDAIGEFP